MFDALKRIPPVAALGEVLNRTSLMRRFLYLLILFSIPALGSLKILYDYFDLEETRNELMRRDRVHLAFQNALILNSFSETFAHLSELTIDPRILDLLAHPGDAARREAAEKMLAAACRLRNSYRRITLVDARGGLLASVFDPVSEAPMPMSVSSSFTTAESEIFRRTMDRPTGEVFMLDLALEASADPADTRPALVLRVGGRIENEDATGALFIDYDFNVLARDAKSLAPLFEGGFDILDEKGNILNPHPSAEDTTEEEQRGNRFPERYPNAWRRILSTDREGQIYIENEGIFTFIHIYPFKGIRLLANETVYERQELLSGGRNAHHWILVSRIGRKVLDRAARPIRERHIRIGAGALCLLSIVCFSLALYIQRHIESERATREALEKLNNELEEARRSIEAYIPRDLSHLPGARAAYLYRPSSKVGGDLFDLFSLPDGRLRILVFDLMGHGVAAALGTAFARALFRRILREPEIGPGAALATAGDEIAREWGGERFLTAFVGEYDPALRILRYAAAGSPPPLMERPGAPPEELPTVGLPAGVMAGVRWEERSVPAPPGARLALYSDGITDQRSPTREMFGEARLRAILASRPGASPEEVRDAVAAALDAFAAGTPASDDITLLVLRFE